MTTTKNNNDPFVHIPNQGEDTTVSAQDMLKLLESLELNPSSVPELQALYESAKNGKPVERDSLMNVVSSLLTNDSQHLGELTSSIGNFEIEF
ncbi:hypothetical protein G6F57_014194 [Rhizopus arrhizus]|uniref:Uncharacterized protein n=1 Tax=Rhizopus oryzae TaxID=64495 RepID=A0A9P6WXM3_RHIOR|nr:hypothetical protein G6F23_011691 [Rhizopus arrhizus]KAG1396214.1 hypothetical protein G6F58_011791 [Rhizopus delemar]KAG0753553.1 hypothetical protein G6F24_012928 [Rhizopus arrhizus]KAG0777309.1 hypothetical protein G6F22_011960 [Rhizopus arrhizus]KAG0784107.1 hypothetical protein G6F21_010118 [Rhizopus arrhizus]